MHNNYMGTQSKVRLTINLVERKNYKLRMFALIVCAQRCNVAAQVTLLICHASLHVLVTIDWSPRQTWRRKRRGENLQANFTPLDHR